MDTKSSCVLNLWYSNPTYHQRCKHYIKEYKKILALENQSQSIQPSTKIRRLGRTIVFKCIKVSKFALKSDAFLFALFCVSILLRLLCMLIIFYVVLVMVHETDSWIPCVILVFCLGIFCDMIYFIKRRKEHTG
jgi:hypothetical protein